MASTHAYTAAAAATPVRPVSASTACTRQAAAPAPRVFVGVVQFIRAREIALAAPYHLRRGSAPASASNLKRKADTLTGAGTTTAESRARCSLLPAGAFSASLFSRPPPGWRLLPLLYPRPPPPLRFRLAGLFDQRAYPKQRDEIFLAFDRTGLLLLSYNKIGARYTLNCWRFQPHQPLRLAASYPLFLSLDDAGPQSDEGAMRQLLGLDGGEEEHLYIQLIEATDSSCFVLVACSLDASTGAASLGAGSSSARRNQSVKAHVSILPSPALPPSTSPRHATHRSHFSFVSSLSVPQVDLLTMESDEPSQPATHCLTFVGVDTLQCAAFTMEASPAPSSVAPVTLPTIAEAEAGGQVLKRTSSLLATALTRVDWLSDLVSLDSNQCELPRDPTTPRLSAWTLEVEAFVRDACVGSSSDMVDYGFTQLRCDGSMHSRASYARTMLLVIEKEGQGSDVDSFLPDRSSRRFEASLIVWSMERLAEAECRPLPWTQAYMRRLLHAHTQAYPASSCSDAERMSQLGAHELLKQAPPSSPAMRRTPTNNAPIFTHKSRPLLLNPAFPLVVVL